jgi:thymidylate synthase (FAD)
MFTTRETRLQDKTNRQNSIEIETDPSLAENSGYLNLITEWGQRQRSVINAAQKAYEWAIENNIAKEQARSVLPEGLTMSRLYMNGTLRSWLHYFDTRCNADTQKEHRQIATASRDIITKLIQ